MFVYTPEQILIGRSVCRINHDLLLRLIFPSIPLPRSVMALTLRPGIPVEAQEGE
jgi:hypothetical protein